MDSPAMPLATPVRNSAAVCGAVDAPQPANQIKHRAAPVLTTITFAAAMAAPPLLTRARRQPPGIINRASARLPRGHPILRVDHRSTRMSGPDAGDGSSTKTRVPSMQALLGRPMICGGARLCKRSRLSVSTRSQFFRFMASMQMAIELCAVSSSDDTFLEVFRSCHRAWLGSRLPISRYAKAPHGRRQDPGGTATPTTAGTR